MKTRSICAVALIAALLEACSGGAGTTPLVGRNPTQSLPRLDLTAATPARPFDPKIDGPVSRLLRFPNPPAGKEHTLRHLPTVTDSHSRSPMSLVSNDGSGFYGTFLDNPNSYGGMYANVTGYTLKEFYLFAAPPQNPYGYDVVYAPTFRPNGGCVEATTEYDVDTSGNESVTTDAYDFCASSPLHRLINIDGNFRNCYERDFGDGNPEYTEEVVQSNGQWSLLIYDYGGSGCQSTGWENHYTSPGTSGASNGWDFFEPHYSKGTSVNTGCGEFLPISSTGIRLYVNGQWVLVTSSSFSVYGGFRGSGPTLDGKQCFSDDGGPGFWYSGSFYCSMAPSPNADCTDPSTNDHQWVIQSHTSGGQNPITLPQSYVQQSAGWPCTLDTYHYCSRTKSRVTNSSIYCNVNGTQRLFPTSVTTTYEIFGYSGYLETATENQTYTTTCYPDLKSTTWSPNEPKVQYGDPNLP